MLPPDRLAREDQQPELARLLTTVTVAFDAPAIVRRDAVDDFRQRCSQAELINRVLEGLFRASDRPQHVLAFGFQKRRDHAISGVSNVQSYHPNTISNYLKGQPWCELLGLVGDQVMLHLLSDVTLFVDLEGDCVLQVSGAPVANSVKHREPLQWQRPQLRHRKHGPAQDSVRQPDGGEGQPLGGQGLPPKNAQAPAGDRAGGGAGGQGEAQGRRERQGAAVAGPVIERNAMFYAAGNQRQLAASHILNLCSPTNRGSARLLSHVLNLGGRGGRLPKRYRGAPQGLFKALLIRYQRCPVAKLLASHCPVDVGSGETAAAGAAEQPVDPASGPTAAAAPATTAPAATPDARPASPPPVPAEQADALPGPAPGPALHVPSLDGGRSPLPPPPYDVGSDDGFATQDSFSDHGDAQVGRQGHQGPPLSGFFTSDEPTGMVRKPHLSHEGASRPLGGCATEMGGGEAADTKAVACLFTDMPQSYPFWPRRSLLGSRSAGLQARPLSGPTRDHPTRALARRRAAAPNRPRGLAVR